MDEVPLRISACAVVAGYALLYFELGFSFFNVSLRFVRVDCVRNNPLRISACAVVAGYTLLYFELGFSFFNNVSLRFVQVDCVRNK